MARPHSQLLPTTRAPSTFKPPAFTPRSPIAAPPRISCPWFNFFYHRAHRDLILITASLPIGSARSQKLEVRRSKLEAGRKMPAYWLPVTCTPSYLPTFIPSYRNLRSSISQLPTSAASAPLAEVGRERGASLRPKLRQLPPALCLPSTIDTRIVHTIFVLMKNITLSADEELIRRAREEAFARKTTLNQLFRDWLQQIAHGHDRSVRVSSLMQHLDHVDAGRKFSREEMNAR